MSNLQRAILSLPPDQRAALLERLKDRAAGRASWSIPRQPRAPRQVFPLSFPQLDKWMLEQLFPDSPVNNVCISLKISGRLDPARVARILNRIIQRQEVFRLAVRFVDGDLVQSVEPFVQRPVPVADLRHLPPGERDATAQSLIASNNLRPFALGREPLWRVTLAQLDDAEFILDFTLHHLLVDRWSGSILAREFGAFAVAGSDQLPDLPVQYVDIAAWQRTYWDDQRIAEHLVYWKRQLSGARPFLEIPTDYLRSPNRSHRGSSHTLRLSSGLSESLRQFSQRAEVTLFMTLLAGFKVLLFQYSGQTDLCVGTMVADRARPEFEHLQGMFARDLALRTRVGGHLSFREVLRRVCQTVRDAFTHQELPFEIMERALARDVRALSGSFFQVHFTAQNIPITYQPTGTPLSIEMLQHENGCSIYDLAIKVLDVHDRLTLNAKYAVEVFRGETVERLMASYVRLLEAIVHDPDQPIASLPAFLDSPAQV